MASLLFLTLPGPSFWRVMDPMGPENDFLPFIATGAAVAVTCQVYPITPATSVDPTTAALQINGTTIAFGSQTGTNPATLVFTVGNLTSGEVAGKDNQIVITIRDSSGANTTFNFACFKTSGGPTLAPNPPVLAAMAKKKPTAKRK
jgi:hypothetical protein